MKNHYLFYLAAVILFQVISLEIQAQAADFAWARRAGGTGADAASRIAVDASGNSYVTGIFRDTASFGTTDLTSSGNIDIFIAKYDGSGNVLWAKQAGGQDIDASKNIEVDGKGNSYITGEFRGSATFGNTTLTSTGSYDLFIAKYDASGNVLWAKQSGGAGSEMGRGIAVDGSGNCYITGYFDGNATFGSTTLTSNGSYDVFIAKYDAKGNFLWANRAGGSEKDFGRNIAVDGSGNSYITGPFRGLASFGSTTLTSSGDEDIFIAKYDASGNVLWAKRAGGTNNDAAIGIAVDSRGNSFIAGEFKGNANFGSTTLTSSGNADIVIAKYDASGNLLWAKQAGGSSSDHGRNIALDGSGNSYITGEFEGSATFGSTTLTSSGGVDIFIAKYDASGNVLWAKRAGGNLEERASGIAIDGSGNLYITGYFNGQASFGNTTVTSSGASDTYIAKLGTITGLPNTTGFHIPTYPNPFANFLATPARLLPASVPEHGGLPERLGNGARHTQETR
ncbi:SBBP repeat-containing protein [Pontibacter toksunensis]|uniref:SBBP repeat-containing protein n=1 Tax=Pontibacter toksunensis TaxID=1332631 RepID=A0ABW6C0C6_9BACT